MERFDVPKVFVNYFGKKICDPVTVEFQGKSIVCDGDGTFLGHDKWGNSMSISSTAAEKSSRRLTYFSVNNGDNWEESYVFLPEGLSAVGAYSPRLYGTPLVPEGLYLFEGEYETQALEWVQKILSNPNSLVAFDDKVELVGKIEEILKMFSLSLPSILKDLIIEREENIFFNEKMRDKEDPCYAPSRNNRISEIKAEIQRLNLPITLPSVPI